MGEHVIIPLGWLWYTYLLLLGDRGYYRWWYEGDCAYMGYTWPGSFERVQAGELGLC